jgi:predicted nucleotidyltransferase
MQLKDLRQDWIIFKAISGSKAYGLDLPTSDTDIKGVFYLPRHRFYALDYAPQVSDEKNDEVYYELKRFVDLLYKNNPNLLELLSTPEEMILYRHPVLDHLDTGLFLSKKCRDTFAGYAQTQIRKAKGLNKKIHNPVAKERKSILHFCYVLKGQGTEPFPAMAGPQWIGTGELWFGQPSPYEKPVCSFLRYKRALRLQGRHAKRDSHRCYFE